MTTNPYLPNTEQYRQWDIGYRAARQGYTYGPDATAAFKNGVLAANLNTERFNEDSSQ